MILVSHLVHQIVASAFHGNPPKPKYVVDHIDTNRQNNRPENLRWVTRFENIMLNPITVSKIEACCGCSVEEFLENPAKYTGCFGTPNYEWMCTVTKQEAQKSKKRLLAWSEINSRSKGGNLGRWIQSRGVQEFNNQELTNSLTVNALQKDWKTPCEFPCCPPIKRNASLRDYFQNLKKEIIFSKSQYSNSIVEDFAISDDEKYLWILTCNSDVNAIKPYSLAKVVVEDNRFIHENLGSFFQSVGAEKQFNLVQGIEWTGEDSIDDFY